MPISSFMVDQVAVAPFSGDDNIDGIPTWGAPVVVLARVEDVRKEIRGAAGLNVVVTTWITTNQITVNDRDRVWVAPRAGNGSVRTFPPGFVYVDADARTPVLVKQARRRDGSDGHVDLYLG